jgi:hypothetical protein
MVLTCSIRNVNLIGSIHERRNHQVFITTCFAYILPGSIKAFSLLGAANVSTLSNVAATDTFCSSQPELAPRILSHYFIYSKYADDLVLLPKGETVLQGVSDGLIEIGRCYGMEMNVEKHKVMRISR